MLHLKPKGNCAKQNRGDSGSERAGNNDALGEGAGSDRAYIDHRTKSDTLNRYGVYNWIGWAHVNEMSL
jgi:hypothetical protein